MRRAQPIKVVPEPVQTYH